ncbi:MAG: DMT family transporter [Sphaerochaetaceae bacterium]|nr:DMT family transporter [Sphaerochaetaceae bacterium]
MNNKRIAIAHALAMITILIWGTTFVSTKVLLRDYAPIEILFFRFIIGYLALSIVSLITGKGFSKFRLNTLRQELLLLGAGISGVTLYFLLENIALTYTLASNVGVIVAIAPFFTALLCMLTAKKASEEERPTVRFFIGFLAAIGGIALLSFSGANNLRINPFGDFLAVLAAFAWAIYSILLKKINTFTTDTVAMTRRIFFYGLLCMAFVLKPLGFAPDLSLLAQPKNFLNILYLGFGASALCFVTWNWATGILGALKTSVYIYLVPVVTVIASAIILQEPVTFWSGAGTLLTVAGLVVSQWHRGKITMTRKTEKATATTL